jgi:hypothetical protein
MVANVSTNENGTRDLEAISLRQNYSNQNFVNV